MTASSYVQWVLEKLAEERERAGIMSEEVGEEVNRVVRVEGGQKVADRVVKKGMSDLWYYFKCQNLMADSTR